MAAYPSYPIKLDSLPEPENGIEDDFDESGGQHSRVFHTSQYYRFSITHPGLTLAQYNSLVTTYQAAPRDEYTLTFYDESPAVTYAVKFLAPPAVSINHGNGRYDVEVSLRGTKN